MTIKKILAFIVLLGFILVNTIPYTHAVQFQWSDVQFIPPVILNDNWNPLWKFYNNSAYQYWKSTAPSNGIVSFLCIAGLDEWRRECSSYILQLSALFILDKTQEIHETISYNIWGWFLNITAQTIEEDPDHIFFTYKSISPRGVDVSKWELAKVNKHKNCGSQDPNICVVVFNPYLYLVSTYWIEWVYMPFVDMLKYSDENDNVVFYRKFLNGSTGALHRDLFSSLIGLFNKYNWNYWQFILPLTHTFGMFYIDSGTDDTTFTVLYDASLSTSVFKYYFWRYSNSKYRMGQTSSTSENAYYGSFINYQTAWDLSQDNTYFMDFLTGKSDKLMYNFKDFFGVSQVGSEIVNPWSSSNPDNFNPNEDGIRECELTQIGCHISNLISSVKNSLGLVFSISLDSVKAIFSWLFENLKSFFLSFLETEFYTIYIKPLLDYFNGFFQPLWKMFTLQYTLEDLRHGDQQYFCSKDTGFFVEETTPTSKKPSEILWLLFYFALPVPPAEGSSICTSLWMKQINYGRNTFLDNTIFVIFFSASIWFIVIMLRKYH